MREELPTLDGGGVPTFDGRRGHLPWNGGGRSTYLGWREGLPTLDVGYLGGVPLG